jgi:hypothetical protein
MTKKGTETLAYKQSVLNGLVTVIELNQRLLNPIEKNKIDALENGLTTRLQALVERSKHEEIDLKIIAMREVKAILKSQA